MIKIIFLGLFIGWLISLYFKFKVLMIIFPIIFFFVVITFLRS